MWVNCLNFWTDVQEYHLLFYAEVIDPYIVQKKAKVESYKQYEKILMQSKSNFFFRKLLLHYIYLQRIWTGGLTLLLPIL